MPWTLPPEIHIRLTWGGTTDIGYKYLKKIFFSFCSGDSILKPKIKNTNFLAELRPRSHSTLTFSIHPHSLEPDRLS